MARSERSAGVILFRLSPGRSQPWQFLLLNYGRHWDYPKGHVHKDEDDLAAALRELEEETGIDDADILPGFERTITYFFRDKKKGLIRKQVVFFLARTAWQRIRLSHEHVGYQWLGFDESINRLTYLTAKQVLRDAQAFLLELGSDSLTPPSLPHP